MCAHRGRDAAGRELRTCCARVWALYQTLELEQYLCKGVSGKRKKKHKRKALGLGVKSLTSVLIFHADLQEENVFEIFFYVFFIPLSSLT